jgi:DNA-binding CsgD family transcriptional regulator/tetratricopeptide (TPR) repeat protein
MPSTRCPVLVGRQREVGVLQAALASSRLGRGVALALTGPAGIGKSRLVRELGVAATAWDVPVVRGRAVPGSGASAFRPLTEALLAGLRQAPELAEAISDGRTLSAFRPLLGRLLPQWSSVRRALAEEPVALAEAVLQLLAALAGARGLVLVLEDLHWAAPETLAVVEYLADNVAAEHLTVLVTAREDPDPAARLVRALAARAACTLLELGPLGDDEVATMADACVGAPIGAAVGEALARRSAGTPLLVEELLAGGDPSTHVPVSFADSVAERLAALPAPARRCVEVAAVLGERADWALVRALTGLGGDAMVDAVRAATACGLLGGGERPDELCFGHALARDAVLGSLLVAEHADWARRGLVEVRRAHPGLDGRWCDLAADLAVRAHDDSAAELLLEAGLRNLTRGALESAATTLYRAHDLAPADPRIQDALADALASAGRTDEAAAVITGRLGTLTGDARTEGEARIRLARVHATAGKWSAADAELVRARRTGADPLRVTAVAAQVAISDARIADARALATEALAGAEDEDRPDIAVDALLILGRLARRDDLAAAERLFTRARALAEEAGLPLAAARAVSEAAITDVQESLRLDRLAEARDLALAVGDLAAAAVVDLQEAAVRVTRWEAEEGVLAGRRCVAASWRLRLATLPKALVLVAAGETLRGRWQAAEQAIAEALALDPAATHLRGEAWHVRATRALDRTDDRTALRCLDRAVTEFRRRPDEVTASPAVGLWIVATTVLERDRDRPPEPPYPVADRWNRGLVAFAGAVALGRRGDATAAAAAFAEADRELREPVDIAWLRLHARRLVASAALADGWGDPGRWAAADLPRLEAEGAERWCAAQRGLLRRSGAVMPRRGRGGSTVPARLRALGVTGREVDVLVLVAEGHGNRVIAERLFLSPRTVEKHVERLLAKTGRPRRSELIADAASLLGADGPEPARRQPEHGDRVGPTDTR